MNAETEAEAKAAIKSHLQIVATQVAHAYDSLEVSDWSTLMSSLFSIEYYSKSAFNAVSMAVLAEAAENIDNLGDLT